MRFRRAAVTALALLALVSCGLLATSIKQIQDNPRDYDGKTVTVAGEIKEATSLLVVKTFVLADATGEIVVITDRAPPKKGTRLRVTGVVHEAFSIGDKSTLVIRESRKEE